MLAKASHFKHVYVLVFRTSDVVLQKSAGIRTYLNPLERVAMLLGYSLEYNMHYFYKFNSIIATVGPW